MIPDPLTDFWMPPRLATLGTVRPDGSAHLIPVKCMRAGDDFVVMSRLATTRQSRVVVNRVVPWTASPSVCPVSVNPTLASTRREAVFHSQTVAHTRS